MAVDGALTWIACGTEDGEVHVIDLGSGKRIFTFTREGEGAEAISFDDSGEFIAYGDRRGRTYIQSVEALRKIFSAKAESLLAERVSSGGFVIKGADVSLVTSGRSAR